MNRCSSHTSRFESGAKVVPVRLPMRKLAFQQGRAQVQPRTEQQTNSEHEAELLSGKEEARGAVKPAVLVVHVERRKETVGDDGEGRQAGESTDPSDRL